ncbi:hypothetical protein SDC9_127449 [bioreactor metagenome]|uniref:Uncharacterized protein n=1 Tax=bioreactor metagenome TaxID=1076179 RepID=A0A645CUM0_9ZZZZ
MRRHVFRQRFRRKILTPFEPPFPGIAHPVHRDIGARHPRHPVQQPAVGVHILPDESLMRLPQAFFQQIRQTVRQKRRAVGIQRHRLVAVATQIPAVRVKITVARRPARTITKQIFQTPHRPLADSLTVHQLLARLIRSFTLFS